MIVLAPQPRNLLEGLRRPSVTANVLARTAAPVLVVPPSVTEDSAKMLTFGGAQVIVPLDGSPLAEKALPLALRVARRYDRPLLLLRVIPPVQIIAAGPETYPLVRDSHDMEVREAHQYLSVLRSRLQRTENVAVQTEFSHGIPAEVILAMADAKPGSVLVMSTHGRTGLARLLMGSVTLAVARKASIPLLIVPSAGTAVQTSADAEETIQAQ